VLFDEMEVASEQELEGAVSVHGLALDKFMVDTSKSAEGYSAEIQKKIKHLLALGVSPCPKHGLTSKNPDDTCEACVHTDYPDDFKGTEG
jgi:hypothetical protein